MSFTRINKTLLNSRGATSLPNQPAMPASTLKAEFDAPAKEILTPAIDGLMDELEDSAAAQSLGALAPTGRTVAAQTVQAGLNVLSTDLATLEQAAGTAIADAHTHSNKAVIDKFDDTGTGLTYDGNPVGAVTSVNGQTGAVSLTASDVGALPSTTSIPTKTSDLTNDSNFVADASYVHTDNNYDATAKAIVDGATAAINAKSTVSWNQIDTTGTKIAEITIDGVKTDVKATGGGSADAYKTITSGGQSFVASGADEFKINAGSNVTITPLQNDKGIQISATGGGQSTGDMLMSDYDGQGNVKTAGGIDAYVTGEIGKLDVSDSAVSGQYVSSVSETDGKISVTRASLPTVPTKVSDLTNDSGYQTASDVSTAISGKEDKSALKDLAYIAKDGVSSTKYLQGDGTWQTFPTGGHTMLPNPASSPSEADCINAINTAVAAGSTNDSVASEYTIGKWSNSFEKVAIVKATSAHPISTTGIGTWQDTLNSPTKADEQGWGWIEWSALHGIGSDNVDVKLTFDPDKCSVPITLGGYIIDDANDMMCIKFGNEITSADTETAWVGIKITITRTAATDITP